MNNLIITIVLLFVFGSVLKADLLPEGKKKISYSFEVTNTDSYPDYTFVAYPVNTSNGKPMLYGAILNAESKIELSCKFGVPVIYAVKTSEFNTQAFDSLNNIGNDDLRVKELKSFIETGKFIPSLKVVCSSYADRDAKYSFVEEQFRVESIETDTMVVRSVRTLYKDSQNNIIDAKDSKGNIRDDIVSPTEKYSSYLFIIIPLLALIGIVSIVLIRKMKK